MSGRVRRYFFSFLPITIILAIAVGFSFCVASVLSFGFPVGLLPGIAITALYWAGMTWMLAWMASRRRVLARPQDAKGLHGWRYLDLAAPYSVVFSGCADILRAFCKTEPTVQDFAKGLSFGETRPSIWSWGSEISLWIEPLGETYTRVQVLSRPLVPINVADFGANERNFNRVVEMLRKRFTVVAEG